MTLFPSSFVWRDQASGKFSPTRYWLSPPAKPCSLLFSQVEHPDAEIRHPGELSQRGLMLYEPGRPMKTFTRSAWPPSMPWCLPLEWHSSLIHARVLLDQGSRDQLAACRREAGVPARRVLPEGTCASTPQRASLLRTLFLPFNYHLPHAHCHCDIGHDRTCSHPRQSHGPAFTTPDLPLPPS